MPIRKALPSLLAVCAAGCLAGCAGGDAPPAPREPAAPAAAPALEPGARPGWELVWADEFDSERIDLESWTPVVMPDPHNNELQYYTDRIDDAPGANAWIEDGALVIEARSEPYEHRRYTSARLNTKGKREFLYGRFEARMQMPGEVGMWPAFWLLGGNYDEVDWPRCGEIDIVEGKGRLDDWVAANLHRGRDWSSNYVTGGEYRLESGSFHDEYHVFAAEWEPQQIRWYVDGELYHAFDKPDGVEPAYWPFDEGHPFFIILNLAVGGWFDHPHLPPEEIEPQRLRVDWVRVYRSTAGD